MWNDNGDYIEIRGKNLPLPQEGEAGIIAHHRNARAEIFNTFVYQQGNYLIFMWSAKPLTQTSGSFTGLNQYPHIA